MAPERALYAVIDSTPVELVGENPQELLTGAAQWRMYVRDIHLMVEVRASNSVKLDMPATRAITGAIGAARVLPDLAEATFERAHAAELRPYRRNTRARRPPPAKRTRHGLQAA